MEHLQQLYHGQICRVTASGSMWPEDPVVDSDHDDDGAPEGHEGGEEGVGEVGVENAQTGVFTDCRFTRPDQDKCKHFLCKKKIHKDLLFLFDPVSKGDQSN